MSEDRGPAEAASTRTEFRGKVALVTGGASGIGCAAVRLFASRGAAVALLDVDLSAARDVAQACASEFHAQVVAYGCDLRARAQVDASVAAAHQRCGRIDVLVNAAGIFPYAAAVETTDELLEDVMAVNFYGFVYCTRAVLPMMSSQLGGAIVNIASGAAVRPIRGLSVYGASKAAMLSYSRSLALELAPSIRVNVVSPGPTDTPGAMAASGSEQARAAKVREIAAQTPMGRLAYAEDVAEAIAFFASDRSRFVTGQNMHVSGGRYMP